jgi:hypothetical protein
MVVVDSNAAALKPVIALPIGDNASSHFRAEHVPSWSADGTSLAYATVRLHGVQCHRHRDT